MRAYAEDEYEDYNDYADEDERYLEDEEEAEEEEDPRPTKEASEYLELRQKLKESLRKRMKKDGISASQDKRRPSYDNFGSFFGPSKPVIAQRVIQESKSFLENKDLAAKILQSRDNAFQKKSSSSTNGSRPGVHQQGQRVVSQIQTKAQKLKDTRDYSFLFSDDAELPASSKQPPRNLPVPVSDARPAKSSLQRNQVSGSNIRQPPGNGDRRPNISNGHLPSRPGVNQGLSANRLDTTSLASKRQLGGNNGIGPGRPALSNGSQLKTSNGLQSRTSNGSQSRTSNGSQPRISNGSQSRTSNGSQLRTSDGLQLRNSITSQSKNSNGIQSRTSNGMLSKVSSNNLQSKVSNSLQPKTPAGVLSKMSNRSSHAQVSRTPVSSASRATSGKVPSSVTKHQFDPRREVRDPSRHMVPPKRPLATTKPQINKPPNQAPSRMNSQDQKIKKRPARPFSDDEEDDGERAISMIRKMFGYNPQRYAGREEDDSDMEANFDEIMMEEKRSSRIARKEDEEQLRLIEEEERREHTRRMAKKRKMSR
ncbi:hypothetical protein MLD38_031364 [Melastoma candidum]|uniref:Uncharacterized protein n=1 Tax=Melastoma candidum TaxID=119954 RepID=A0ACB9MQP8_9MYRT|nr:hypothetical protein MLD38_031364 [Melastoma candidum]